MDDKKIEFLYQSINDTQATIRALDVKIGFLFVVIFLPLAAIQNISQAMLALWISPYHFGALSVVVGIMWFFSVYFLFKSLSAITGINKHMVGVIPEDNFYEGGVPNLTAKDIFSIDNIRAKKTVAQFLAGLPHDEASLLEELASEKMKLSLLRNVKSLRVRICTNLTLLWLAVGMFLSVVFLFRIGVAA